MTNRTPYLILLMGLLAVSTAALLIRFSNAPALVIAFYRLFWAAVIFLPVVLIRHRGEMASIARRHLYLTLLSGAFLAVHFALWIASLDYTPVANSVLLVSTHPVLIIVIQALLWGRKPSLRTVAGIGLALAGTLIITRSSLHIGDHSLLGDALALGGAVMMVGYLLAGRYLRQHLSLVPYIFITYLAASAALLAVLLIGGWELIAHPAWDHLIFLLLALIPTAVGHSSFNWALKHIPTHHVSISILGEPVGASVLAYIVLRETPTPLTMGGGALVLAGIYFVVGAGRGNTIPPASRD